MSKKITQAQSDQTARAQALREKQGNKVIQVIAAVFFIGIMAVVPMFITRIKYGLLIQYKTDFLYAFTAVTAVLITAAILCLPKRFKLNNYYKEGVVKRRLSFPEWAVIAFLALTLISALFSQWQQKAFFGAYGRYEGFWTFLCYGASFFIVVRFYKPKRAHLLIIAAGSILMIGYGILQFFDMDFLKLVQFGVYPFEIEGPLSAHFRTTLGNVDVVSAYCSLAGVLFTALYTVEKSRWRFLYLAASIMSFAIVLIAKVDAGKVGILAAMVILIPYWVSDRVRLGRICIAMAGWSAVYAGFNGYLAFLKNNSVLESLPPGDAFTLETFAPVSLVPFIAASAVLLALGLCLVYVIKKWPEKPMKIAGVVFLAVSVAGGLLLVEVVGSRYSDQPNNIVWQAREMMRGNIEDDFGSGRGWIWKNAVPIIPNNPILGTGPGTFEDAMGEDFQQASQEKYGPTFDDAHNVYLQMAVCLGIPALLAFLAFIAGVFVPAVKKAFSNPLLFAFGAAALSYVIQCFFEISVPVERPLLWVVLAVMAGEVWREKNGLGSKTGI